VFVLMIIIENETGHIESEFRNNLDATGHLSGSHHYHFKKVSDEYLLKRIFLGLGLMLVYMKILSIVKLHRNVGPISIAIIQTLFNRKVLYFAIIMLINLMALAFACFFTFGTIGRDFRSFFWSLLIIFRIIFGEYWEYDIVSQQASLYGPVFLLFTVLFGNLLLINVLNAIIFDIYRSKNEESESNWETDIVNLQITELLGLLHRVGKEQESGGEQPIITQINRFLPKSEYNNAEIDEISEWNKNKKTYRVLLTGIPIGPAGISLFPDPDFKDQLLEGVEEDRTTDSMIRNLNEKVSILSDRSETMEKTLKGLSKTVIEIHSRLFPNQKGPPQQKIKRLNAPAEQPSGVNQSFSPGRQPTGV